MPNYQAKIYPDAIGNPTVSVANPQRKSLAVCFSGGGSRALTCAWGQLIGLHALKNPAGHPLMDEVRYISSVSGGTWASVLYNFLPEDYSYSDFLGDAYDPSQLYIQQPVAGGLNVNTMGASALGRIPQNFANLFDTDPLRNILIEFIIVTSFKRIPLSQSLKWLWFFIVGKNVLADFQLYRYSFSIFQGKNVTPWQFTEAKFFSVSKDYAAQNIFSLLEAPPADEFIYAREGAQGPSLIMNTNIVGAAGRNVLMSGPVQIPVQITAAAASIHGANPFAVEDIGGGGVESFAFASQLQALTAPDRIRAGFDRHYTLADITACSSAFYAAMLADPLEAVIARLLSREDEILKDILIRFLGPTANLAIEEIRAKLAELNAEIQSFSRDDLLHALVPQYNYWPVSQAAQGAAANRSAEFTDGGDLENTGVAGLLSQVRSGVGNILSFVNGSEHLQIVNNQIIAATQMAPLFGVCYDESRNQFKDYLTNGVNPFTGLTDPTGFLQVFENKNGEFNTLRKDLYNSNNPIDPNNTNSRLADYNPAYSRQTLKVIPNALLGITESFNVNVLWVQNAVVGHWQQQIGDRILRERIANGQQQGGVSEFANFPYYDTFLKIHLDPGETNVLAQMWAWSVSNADSPLSKEISNFFANAGD